MTAKNVTNHHDGPLDVGGVVIPAGKTAAIPRWDQVKGNATIKTWLDMKVISVDGDTPTPQSPDVVKDPDANVVDKSLEDMTKAELVDYGKAKGLDIDASNSKADIFDQIVDAGV